MCKFVQQYRDGRNKILLPPPAFVLLLFDISTVPKACQTILRSYSIIQCPIGC